MKKLFLFLAASTLALSSCSSDDDGGSETNRITLTMNNQTKVFDVIEVVEEVHFGGSSEEYTELTVTGVISSNPTEFVEFYINKGDTGIDAIGFLSYINGAYEYLSEGPETTFTSNVTTNNNSKKLVGTMSGDIQGPAGGTIATIASGSFNIQY